MNTKLKKLLCVALSALLLVPALAACSTGDEPDDSKAETTGKTEVSTDPVDQALNELKGKVDWKGEEFGILYSTAFASYRSEVEAQANFTGESGNAVLNDAVFERNTLFQEYCNLKFVLLPTAADAFSTTLTKGVQTGTKDFYICTQGGSDTAAAALQGYLYNYLDLDIDYDHEWWDQGTLNFALDGRVFFMNGPFNMVDDDCTYFVAFNKKLQQQHQLPNLYQTVHNLDWTMEYMNSIISNLSTDNGDGVWDEKDTYGLTATNVMATAFFYGSGLKYVDNSLDKEVPELIMDDKMDRLTDVMEITRSIIHDNNSTYLGIGMEIFKNDRALFGFEIVSYLRDLNASMESEYGALPVPKFDKSQDRYYAFSNASVGTTLSIPTSVAQNDMDMFSKILEMYCLLSQKLVKPAYYEITLMTRSVQDQESAEMLDLIFSSRVYDMAAYFGELSLSGIFEEAAVGTADNYSSKYTAAKKRFNKTVKNMLVKLQRAESKN
jgi:hypothetical protein